jgi:hypothetical protein
MPSRTRWLAIAPFGAVTSSTGQPMQGVAGTAGCSAWRLAVPAARAAASRIEMFLMMKSPFRFIALFSSGYVFIAALF